jgi:hypothetical protein
MKTSQAENLTRSAIAPEIRATVMMANISWNAANTVAGMVAPSQAGMSIWPFNPRALNPPSRPPPMSEVNAIE